VAALDVATNWSAWVACAKGRPIDRGKQACDGRNDPSATG
jgi:hypothetical protein